MKQVAMKLAPSVDRDQIDDALAALGLRLVNIVERTSALPRQLITVLEGSATQVVFVDAASLYAVVRGPDADELCERLRASLPVVADPEDALLRAWEAG